MACRRSRHRKSAPAAAPVARSLSLRAASFREAVPGSSAFRRDSVQHPKQKRDDRARNAAAIAAASAGDLELFELITRS